MVAMRSKINMILRYLCPVGVGFWVLNYCGVLDHLVQVPFVEFKWMPFMDVRAKVDAILAQRETLPPTNVCGPFHLQPSRPLCPSAANYFLRIVVKSTANHHELRQNIRTLWGRARDVHLGGRTFNISSAVFVLGQGSHKTNDMVRREHQVNGDILQTDFVDAYFNNTRKFLCALDWLRVSICPDFEFVLFVDDDYHVSLTNAVRRLASLDSIDRARLYMGFRFDSGPFRMRFHKHYVDLAHYPYDAYPPYITAGAIVFSSESANEFFLASHFAKLFPFDDIYIGILAKLLGIEPMHDNGFRFWTSWSYKREEYRNVIAAHGFEDLDLMTRAFVDSEH